MNDIFTVNLSNHENEKIMKCSILSYNSKDLLVDTTNKVEDELSFIDFLSFLSRLVRHVKLYENHHRPHHFYFFNLIFL